MSKREKHGVRASEGDHGSSRTPSPPQLPAGAEGGSSPSSSAKPSPEVTSSGGRDDRRLIGTTAAPRDQRFSARKKREAITRLLRGETLDALARELGVTAATLSEWRDTFLAAGEAALKTRGPTAQDAEVRQLKEALGDMAMRLELAREANRRLGLNVPFGSRRSRP